MTARVGPARFARGVAGAMAMALAVVTFAAAGGRATAQDQQEVATVTRQAFFTRPATEVAPPLLFNGFPPSTACLVAGLVGAPQLCGETIADIADLLGLSDGLPLPSTPDSSILQPVVPGTTPVGMLLGQERYASLLQLALPAVPEGQKIGRFELVLQQAGLNFALESPAFRQLVLAAISQIDETDPTLFATALADIVNGKLPALAQHVTGIEACPVLEPWNGGDAQDAALDGTRLPDASCIQGTTGVYDPALGTWTFDLTFAAQAWTSDDPEDALANEGIILRPVGAPNLAYGDPDLSTNFLVSLGDGEAPEGQRPLIRYATVPASRPSAPPPAAPVLPSGPSGVTVTPLPSTGAPATASPEVVTVIGAITARWAEQPAGGNGDTSLWLLLLVPLALGGAYLFGGALLAEPPAIRRQPGALSRLMARRGDVAAQVAEEEAP